MRCRLTVDVDLVGQIRRLGTIDVSTGRAPDPVDAAMAAERAGVEAIAVRLREERNVIAGRDVEVLRRTVTSRLDLSLPSSQDMLTYALEVRPDRVVFVPDERDGLAAAMAGTVDAVQARESIARGARLMQDAGIWVSVRIPADLDQVRAAHKANVDGVFLHGLRYSEARNHRERSEELARIRDSAKTARKLGLEVAVGDDLGYHNAAPVARIAEVSEIVAGHAVVARAVMVGFEQACRDLVDVLRDARIDLLGS
ncbi:MAG: pyridoxine 5'-phosphate synthase [Myxococcota bacterium]